MAIEKPSFKVLKYKGEDVEFKMQDDWSANQIAKTLMYVGNN